ncbi:unnamed protein product, partial [Symbiodinium sp. KB8]
VAAHFTGPVQVELITHGADFSKDMLVLDPAVFPHIMPGDLLDIRAVPTGLDSAPCPKAYAPSTACLATVPAHGKARGNFALSLDQHVAEKHGLRSRQTVVVRAADVAAFQADFAEVSIRDQFISRAGVWRVLAQLAGRCVHVGQNLNVGGARVQVRSLRHYLPGRGRDSDSAPLTSGIIHHRTKVALRSRSANIILALQRSREMWDYADDGELFVEKALSRFLATLTQRWNGDKVSHSVTVVVFSRTFFDYDVGLLQWLGLPQYREGVGEAPSAEPSTSWPHCIPPHFPSAPVQSSPQPPSPDLPPDLAEAHTKAMALMHTLGPQGKGAAGPPGTTGMDLYADVIRGDRALVLGARGQVQEDSYHVVRVIFARLKAHVDLLRLLGSPPPAAIVNVLGAAVCSPPVAVLHPGQVGASKADVDRLHAEAAALAHAARFSGQGVPSSCHEGNFLQAVNLCLNEFARSTVAPSLHNFGQHIVLVAPGAGHYQVDFHLSQLTKQRIMDAGVGCDLVN